jgi:hypothetical protein
MDKSYKKSKDKSDKEKTDMEDFGVSTLSN